MNTGIFHFFSLDISTYTHCLSLSGKKKDKYIYIYIYISKYTRNNAFRSVINVLSCGTFDGVACGGLVTENRFISTT